MADSNARMEQAEQMHLAAMTELFVAVFNGEPWNDEWTDDAARQRLAEILATPGAVGVCMFEDDEMVGFALGHAERWFTGKHFFLKEMCVQTPLQRSGYGTALLQALEHRLGDMEQVYLLTARDSPAQSFYERNGFRAAHRQGMFLKRLSTPRSD